MAALAGEALAERQMSPQAPSLEQYDRTVRELMGRLRGQGVLEPVAR